jgi:hypothetical protein
MTTETEDTIRRLAEMNAGAFERLVTAVLRCASRLSCSVASRRQLPREDGGGTGRRHCGGAGIESCAPRRRTAYHLRPRQTARQVARLGGESWLRRSEQRDRWSFCLTAANACRTEK